MSTTTTTEPPGLCVWYCDSFDCYLIEGICPPGYHCEKPNHSIPGTHSGSCVPDHSPPPLPCSDFIPSPCCVWSVSIYNGELIGATLERNNCEIGICPDITDPHVRMFLKTCDGYKLVEQLIREIGTNSHFYIQTECGEGSECEWICTNESGNLVWRINSLKNCGNPYICYPNRDGQPCFVEGETCNGTCKNRKRCAECVVENNYYYWKIRDPDFLDIPCTQINWGWICETNQKTAYIKDCEKTSVLWKCVYLDNVWQWQRLTEDCDLPHAVTPLACNCPEPNYPCNPLHQNEVTRVNCKTEFPRIKNYDPARSCNFAFISGRGWQVVAASQTSQNCDCRHYIPYLNTYMADFNPITLPMPCIEEETEPETSCIWECISGNWVLVNRPSSLMFTCNPPLVECNSSLEGVQEGTQPVTTTPTPKLEPGDLCLWRCGPYESWEIVRGCRIGNYCPEPSEDCTYNLLGAERYTQCYTFYTTTTSTTTTYTPELQCAQTYCRWICTINQVSKEFEWTLIYSCPEQCACNPPIGPCDASNVCAKQAIPCVPAYTTQEPPDYGCCQVLCSGGRYVLIVQDCQGDYRCSEVGKPCYLEGDLRIFPCSPPESTTTTQTTSTTPSIPNYSEGYCTYECLENKLILINSNCASGFYCPDIINAYCSGNINYIQCFVSGSESVKINDSGVLYVLSSSFQVQSVTTAEPISIELEPGYIYVLDAGFSFKLSDPEPEFKPCPGNCMYVWNPEDKKWILYSRTCPCNCYPPTGSGPGDRTETREGSCGEAADYLSPPEFEEPQWPQPPEPPEPEAPELPDCSYDSMIYPNGICKYKCQFGVYYKLCQNCTLDKTCAEIYIDEDNPICIEDDVIIVECS